MTGTIARRAQIAPQLGRLVLVLGTMGSVQTVVCAEERAVTCTKGEIDASVSPVEPSLSLKCGQPGVRGTLAGDPLLQVYTEGSCRADSEGNNEKLLKKLGAAGSWSGTQLSITEFPEQNKKVCLLCKEDDQVTCTVVVDIIKKPATCTSSDATGELGLILAEKETVYFKCPKQEDKLTPGENNLAYQGECGSETQELPSELERRENKGTKNYSLTLKTSPKAANTFCYKCSSNGEKKTSDSCFIKVTTKTTTQETTSTSSDPSTSATVIPNSSFTVAFGAALVLALRML